MTINAPASAAGQQQGTQTVEKDEIWSTILTGVASSKMVPTKKLLVLGDPGTAAITTLPLPIDNLDDDATNTLALGYNFIDVQDEDNEAIARLGVYQLGLSAVEYMPLLKFALGADTLADSAVIIVLDWTRPWEFLETFQRWINVLQHRMDEICKEGSAGESWSRGKAVEAFDSCLSQVEHYLQTYTEPVPVNTFSNMAASTSTGSVPSTPTTFVTPLVTTTTSADQVTLPLTQGTLTNNLGISHLCRLLQGKHSDAQNTLEQTLDYKDEQFDFIQQTLRCICMKSLYLPQFAPIHPSSITHTATKSYPFKLKAQVVERDSVLVPAGWDSWGKLRVLREGFDCEAVHQGWDSDMDAVADRQQPGAHGCRGNYEQVIANPNATELPLTNVPPPVTCEDEQAFLDRHFETLQHGSELPGRKGTGATAAAAANVTTRPSVVGPLGVSSALDFVQDHRGGGGGVAGSRHKDVISPDGNSKLSSSTSSSTTTNASSVATKLSSLTSGLGSSGSGGAVSTSGIGSNAPLSPIDTNHMASPLGGVSQSGVAGAAAAAAATGGGGPSHETSSSSGGSSPTATSLLGGSSLNGGSASRGGDDSEGSLQSPSSTGASARRPTISRKDVHKELDRMRQYVNKP
ncbi:dynein light intermediate chain-domain-containing protein [Mucor lusitanicus]